VTHIFMRATALEELWGTVAMVMGTLGECVGMKAPANPSQQFYVTSLVTSALPTTRPIFFYCPGRPMTCTRPAAF